jgi:hypothetical protein
MSSPAGQVKLQIRVGGPYPLCINNNNNNNNNNKKEKTPALTD